MSEGTEEKYSATILLVDDKPANIKLLFDALEGTGYRTLAALDGESAVQQAALARPDLILMDVMMPGIDGFEACRRLRAQPKTRHIPVIFMTALTETSDKIKGFEAGGVDYLTKPLQHEEVLARIDSHVNRHRFWSDVDAYSRILLEMGAAKSLEEVWKALAALVDHQPDVAGLAVWLASERMLRLHYASGFAAGGPSSWRSARGDYTHIALDDNLLGPVFSRQQQVARADDAAWEPRPSWARAEGLRAYILTPVCVHDTCLGVLAVFYNSFIRFAFEERQRWQNILGRSLGNAVLQSRARESIRRQTDQLKQENEGLRAVVSASAAAGGMVGTSHALNRTLSQADLVAPTEAAVLILGESGTGKELLARRLHENSQRREEPIIRVNCAAIPHELFESEFFGHAKGSFTGALRDRVGRFELANRGTLFLDEVGEIPLELQGKLLRVLQEGTLERIGEEKTRKVDVRIIAATNHDLRKAISDGRFRQDLFYRLSVFPITIPPLRERRDDIPLLIRHFAAMAARRMGLATPPISDETIAPLLDYAWPGNIRELQNEVERAVILSRGGPLTLSVPRHAAGASGHTLPSSDRIIREAEWETMQRENTVRALRASAWRVDGPQGAAELLGLRPTTLRSRIKAMNISRPV